MVTRLHLFIVIALSLLLTSVVLIMYTQQREREFLDHQLEIQRAMVEGAARDISFRLEEQIRHVRLFNDEYRQLLSHLALYPYDEYTKGLIDSRLKERFPNVDAFTITNAAGVPMLDDFEGNIGEVCQRDISAFSSEVKRLNNTGTAQNAIFIHPQADRYHYDVMADIKYGSPYVGNSIFLVSFKPKSIQHILKSREIPGHKLMLTKLHDRSLIEINDEGTRDAMAREGRLSKDELLSIKASENIPNTNWVMIDLKDASYEEAYIRRLWKESGGIILIVAVTNIFIFMIFSTRIKYAEIRESKRENKAYPWVNNESESAE
jgi:hypothetical protein